MGRKFIASAARWRHASGDMRPTDIQVLGDELAIKWDDGGESYLKLELLRRACPCAGCQGERDVLGHLHQAPAKPLSPQSFQLVRLDTVGTYALQPVWADGHATGLYSFAYLRLVAEAGT